MKLEEPLYSYKLEKKYYHNGDQENKPERHLGVAYL